MTLPTYRNPRSGITKTCTFSLITIFIIASFNATATGSKDTIKNTNSDTIDLRKNKDDFDIVNKSGLSVTVIPDKANVQNSFYQPVNFQSSHFKGVQIQECDFKENVNFSGGTFSGNMDMSSSIFEKTVDFSKGTFNGNANFYFSTFGEFADFWHIRPNDTTTFNFYYAHLPDLIDFSGIGKLHGEVDFTVGYLANDSLYRKHRWHYINLFQTDPSFVRIDYAHFRLCFFNNNEPDESLLLYLTQGKSKIVNRGDGIWVNNNRYPLTDNVLLFKALLDDCVFKGYLNQLFPTAAVEDDVIKIFVHHWLQNANFPERLTREQTISIYERVLKSFDAKGQKESYESLDIQYRNFKNGNWIVPYIWYRYGYSKWLIFLWTLGFLVLFTVITYFTYPVLNKSVDEGGVYYIDNINDNGGRKKVNDGQNSNLWKAFFYTATIFFLFSLKVENINFRKPGVIYILVVYFTGLLCLGYLANFILQK